jgi:hypothetical protein
MENHTDRIHRLLLLWLDLQNAMTRCRPRQSESEKPPDPWNSPHSNVREIWDQLTHPDNLLGLEEWLCQCSDGQTAEWARKALLACRQRRRKT